MPWHQEAMKDVIVCEKLRGVDKLAVIRRCPNGETLLDKLKKFLLEYIEQKGERRELKHLSSARKIKRM